MRIGAVVPWAGKLWYLTYPPHALGHSLDKLYSLAPDMNATIHPESVGGTHAGRMIHRESNQLIIGPYFVREDGSVRAAPRDRLPGRITAVTRHLTDPANFVYFVEMEGSIHEVNVHTLEAKLLFVKPVPGWHGKGGYVGQGHLIVSNNGDSPGGSTHWKLDWSEGIQSIHRQFDAFLKTPRTSGPEDAGVLAEWNGDQWRVVIPRQFTDITGPGGLWGEPSPDAPVWAIGWDKRSVLLYVRYQNAWHTYRVPKADYAFDPRHGYYTEWPRIREINDGRFLMVMHGMMFDFPRLPPRATAGLPARLASLLPGRLRAWNGRIVLARDDTSIMQNPLAGLSQSNLQLVAPDALPSFGPRAGWGGVWINDAVQGDVPSDPSDRWLRASLPASFAQGRDARHIHPGGRRAGRWPMENGRTRERARRRLSPLSDAGRLQGGVGSAPRRSRLPGNGLFPHEFATAIVGRRGNAFCWARPRGSAVDLDGRDHPAGRP